MRKKTAFYAEGAYILGILLLALGTALITKVGFGLSMIVAPAYLLHLFVSETLSFFSFGMAEYVFQALIILLLCLLLRRFRVSYLLSFATAVIYGFTLDGMAALTSLLPGEGIPARIGFYAAGTILATLGVALLFHTYLPPEAYELFVRELASARGWKFSACKTVYDLSSLALAILLSFLVFGRLEAIGIGTFVNAVLNGLLIGFFGKGLERLFSFRDGLPLRRFFEK